MTLRKDIKGEGVMELAVVKLDSGGRSKPETRRVPTEEPLALVYNGVPFSVMMVTPEDLKDYAIGFSLNEGIVSGIDELASVEITKMDEGTLAQLEIPDNRREAMLARRRNIVGQTSCGLCGVEELQEALRPLTAVAAPKAIESGVFFRALRAIEALQPMNRETGAVHAAAFVTGTGEIALLREDVGRHNALDKLVGALAGSGVRPRDGFLLLTSRASYELVQKAITAGFSLMVTISAPTSLAIDLARDYGLTLVALARADSVLVFNDPGKLFS